MNLSKETEQEIRHLYQAYWDAYLGGDFETFASFLDDDVVIYGTAVGEIFTTKEDALKFYLATSEEMTGKAEFRNREIRIKAIGNSVAVYELSQLYILIEDTWTYYGYARITGILEKKTTGWKLVHQHGSFPDGRTEEGQQIAADKIKAENAQLREAVMRRTVELENKTRELEIEPSLERVRTVAMGMRKPDDMLSVCETIAAQLELLDVKHVRNVQTAIVSGAISGYYLNYQYFTPYQEGIIEHVAIEKHPRVRELIDRMQAAPDAYFPASFKGKDLDEWRQYRKEDNQFPDPILDETDAVYFHFYSIGQGGIGLSAYEELRPQDLNLFHRFRNVFALAYQRFRDIEQAGMQAREAHIEAALERLRSRTMAMQRSEELAEVVKLLYAEFDRLNITNESTDIEIGLINEETGIAAIWGHLYLSDGTISTFSFPFGHFDQINHEFQQWKQTPIDKRNELFITTEFSGDLWDKFVILANEVPELAEMFRSLTEANITKWVTHNAYFSHGLLTLQGTEAYPPETLEIQKRFAKVFEQTYTRFLDLQKAEAQAREAQIESGLERIRSRTMAMQSCDELSETAAVALQELVKLGLAPHRLYIALIENDQTDVHFYLTNEDGGKDCSVYTAQVDKNPFLRKMYDGWAEHRPSITLIMEGDELDAYLQYLREEVGVPYRSTILPQRRVQTIAYFSQGYIGIVSNDDQPAETTKLLERFAAVFNLTYTRFNDLKHAEKLAHQANLDLIRLKEEKLRTELALAELKAAQAQLIQSEKMASLGELTAGIAHEIQNPLNFVNNFSEVSHELLDEMTGEMATGHTQEAIFIAADVKQNLEKIIYHGKRADGIVKGMLMHSRISSGSKEPTDINALADEYMRLAYHGMRAKDKMFNATIRTDLDVTLGKIQVIPQDIGRVLLNLLTNAFYAVSAPKGDLPHNPTVVLSTKKLAPSPGDNGCETVQISISDNGPGIPDHIKDKIFQPFFTTKPTGQGTGLGLSLSYDIIKAHGGRLEVDTIENSGSTFIVTLPLHQSAE